MISVGPLYLAIIRGKQVEWRKERDIFIGPRCLCGTIYGSGSSRENVTSSIFTSGSREGGILVDKGEKFCQRPPGSRDGCQYNHWQQNAHLWAKRVGSNNSPKSPGYNWQPAPKPNDKREGGWARKGLAIQCHHIQTGAIANLH